VLRCRNSERLLAELDWAIFAMALAELIARRQQLDNAAECGTNDVYDPKDRSLANTMRALRKCMRQLHKYPEPDDDLLRWLSRAVVQRYNNRTNKQARYRPKNPEADSRDVEPGAAQSAALTLPLAPPAMLLTPAGGGEFIAIRSQDSYAQTAADLFSPHRPESCQSVCGSVPVIRSRRPASLLSCITAAGTRPVRLQNFLIAA
jgi:hypothetical protein